MLRCDGDGCLSTVCNVAIDGTRNPARKSST
jgi:hypothetical protein